MTRPTGTGRGFDGDPAAIAGFRDIDPRRRYAAIGLGVAYLLLHLLTLPVHPFVHSDEAWLASLTRAMIREHSPAAIEDVFRVTPRHPHALKSLYHILQMPFVAVSWSAFAARLPSLLAGMAALMLTADLGLKLTRRKAAGFLPALLMAVDPQFWYLSHLGRQEMMLIALYLTAWDLRVSRREAWLPALPLAAAIFVHPNAFIMAIPVGTLFLFDIIVPGDTVTRRRADRPDGSHPRLQALLSTGVFAGILAAAAAAAIAVSFLMDPDFIAHYTGFGERVGVGDSWQVKMLGLPGFLAKMARRRAGTYYLADVRPFYIAGLAGLVTAFVRTFRGRADRMPAGITMSSAAVMAGMAAVGKYGPPTIGFLMPSAYLLFGYVLAPPRSGRDEAGLKLKAVRRTAAAAAVILIAGWSLVSTIGEIHASRQRSSYGEYLEFIADAASPLAEDERVLANLNTAFAFEYDRLLIWRDLAGLEKGSVPDGSKNSRNTSPLEDLINSQNVRYIILPDELKLIYDSRPVWNGVYGNIRWYPDLMEIIQRRGVLVAEASFPDYAMRIVPYMDRQSWGVRVFRIE